LNSFLGTVAANAAIVPAGTGGSVNVFVFNNTDVIIDINGYYAPQSGITLAQGSAGAPSLSFAGDSGTGIFSSGGGMLNIATGGASRVRVLSNGDLDLSANLDMGGNRILSNTGSQNLFVGVGAGVSNTGQDNSFFGFNAGFNNTTATGNSFFGSLAGFSNTAIDNSFFGASAGQANTTGYFNSFFGIAAGVSNKTEHDNTFIGASAGQANGTNDTGGIANFNTFVGSEAGIHNTTGLDNSFFGAFAGQKNTVSNSNSMFGTSAGYNTTGGFNSFFGTTAGSNNTTGSNDTFVGFAADGGTSPGDNNTLLGAYAFANSGISNSAAIGYRAEVDAPNSLVLGSINGFNGATASTSVGIGTTRPGQLLTVNGPVGIWGRNQAYFYTDQGTTLRGYIGQGLAGDLSLVAKSPGDWLRLGANNANIAFWTNGNGDVDSSPQMALTPTGLGIGTASPDQQLSVNGNADKSGGGGSWGFFSDERLKNINGPFTPGLETILQLQPIRFEYKPDNALGLKPHGEQIGFSAQAVQKLIPEAVSTNDKGYLLINNDPIMWTMLNAIKQQQSQIEDQQKRIAEQQEQNRTLEERLAALEKLLSTMQTNSAAQ
jgi:hypothetical protein